MTNRAIALHGFSLVLLLTLPSVAGQSPKLEPAAEKPSLKRMADDFGQNPKIIELYRETEVPQKALKKGFEKPLAVLDSFLKEASQSRSFARGEIEDEKVIEHLISMLQLSVVRTRTWNLEKDADKLRRELGTWLQFAADFAYEESSFIGLRVASLLRSLVMDELERLEKQRAPRTPEQVQAWVEWNQQLRMPWPIDRVILAEGRRTLEPRLHGLASQLAARLQANPYQEAGTILDRLPGGKTLSTEYLRRMWAEKDLDQMKEEVTRLQALQLRWGIRLREVQGQKPPHKIADVAQAAGFSSVPVNYKTGRPWDLETLSQF